MKKFFMVLLSVVMVMGIGVGSSSAENSLSAGNIGVSVGMATYNLGDFGDTYGSQTWIAGKLMIMDGMAALAGLAFENHSGDADGTSIGISIGARKYLNTDDFAPFLDGRLSYIIRDVETYVDEDLDIIDLSLGFGAEYFFNKQFSVEGSVGVGIGRGEDDKTDSEDVYITTRTIGVKANFYFK
ncbi:MAG: hypothetical protein SVY10_21760 [Thermodesulfobacteriota bacterium]|nr:hypothetical protein [Thermodesulfobacteriota bacterium]